MVHSFSRFFRDHFELEFYIRKLAKNGVKLVSITQEMGDDPKRLYDAIENGIADVNDSDLKDRIATLKASRDQAKSDAERVAASLGAAGQKAVAPDMLSKFAATARQRMRIEGGGYRREHVRALAQRVEVDVGEVRILGSKSNLLQALVAGASETKPGAVPSFVPKWCARQDSNLRPPA